MWGMGCGKELEKGVWGACMVIPCFMRGIEFMVWVDLDGEVR